MPTSLKLREFSDRDLLFIIDETADYDGWARAQYIAERIGLNTKYPERNVSSRLAWMVRFGVIHRHPEQVAWQLTNLGEALRTGKISRRQQDSIDKMDDAQMLLLTRSITRRYEHASSDVATVLRREWTYGTAQRQNGAKSAKNRRAR